MLNEADRDRIRAEEIFRAEVRDALAAKSKSGFPARLLRFLNTGLGLWLLSTAAVGTISFTYAKMQAHYAAQTQRQERSEKLMLETQVRLREMKRLLAAPEIATEIESRGEFLLLFSSLMKAPGAAGPGLQLNGAFPEFRDSPLLALLLEQYKLSDDAVRKERLDDLAQSLTESDVLEDPQVEVQELLERFGQEIDSAIPLFSG